MQVVYIYELLCRGEDPSADSPEFWNEFFLLQPNFESLEDQVSKLNNEQLQVVKPNLNTLFQKCIEMLDTSKGRTACLNATCNAQPIFIIALSCYRGSSKALVQQPSDLVLSLLWHIQEVQYGLQLKHN